MLVDSFIEYIIKERNYSSHTAIAYRKDIESFRDFCQKEYGVLNLQYVSYSRIRLWIVHLVQLGISNASINRKVSSLKSFYNFLQKSEQIEKSPFAKHKVLKTSKRIQIPFSQIELEKVLDSFNKAKKYSNIRDKLIIELLYTTGIRRSELIQLQLNSLDLVAKQIKVLGKRNKERILPLLPKVINTLNEYLSFRKPIDPYKDYLLLTDSGKKMYGTFVYRKVQLYLSKVSTKKKKSPHIIRHSFATHLLDRGADLTAVKDLLGHSSLVSTEVYTQSSLSRLKEIYKQAHPRSSKNIEL